MRQVRGKFLTAVGTALAFGLGSFGVALAHEGHDRGAPHGGTFAETKAHQCEPAVTKAPQADQAAINALKVCPVSHEELGSMGPPLKISRGGKSTFLCCKGCLKEIRANPDKFLGASAAAPAPDAKPDHHNH